MCATCIWVSACACVRVVSLFLVCSFPNGFSDQCSRMVKKIIITKDRVQPAFFLVPDSSETTVISINKTKPDIQAPSLAQPPTGLRKEPCTHLLDEAPEAQVKTGLRTGVVGKKLEPLCTAAGRDVRLCSCCGKQPGGCIAAPQIPKNRVTM